MPYSHFRLAVRELQSKTRMDFALWVGKIETLENISKFIKIAVFND